MRKPDWRRLFHLPRKRPTPGSSPTSHSPPLAKQEAPVSVPEPILSPATANEAPISNPEPVLSPPTPSGLLPQMSYDAPTPVTGPVSTPTLPPTKTITNQEIPKRDSNTQSSPPPPAQTTSASSIGKTVGNGLIVALKLLKEAVTGIGVPGLEATVNGVVGVIDLIKDVRDNADDLNDLNGLISNLANAMSMAPNFHNGVDVPESLLSRLNRFLSELHGILTELRQMLGVEGLAIRTANSQAYKEAIEESKEKMNFLLSRFSTEGILSLELNMATTQRNMKSMDQAQQTLAVTQEHLAVTQNAQEYENLINAIPRAHARYNDTSTKPSRPCHPGTRTGLLEIIAKWIVEDPDAKPYFWLCGEVGVGKTTVAHTIAQEQQSLKRLGASFFFSRHDDSRRNPHLLFTSIAYQMARFDGGFYKALAETLKPDPDIVKRTPMEQFQRLVLEPLARSGIDASRTVVIVIDGLDECSDPAAILDVLAQGIDEVGAHLRILISSRPYSVILSKFETSRLCHLTSETKFRDINPKILSDDVAAYLSWSLGDIASRWRLPSPWPPEEQLDQLIKRAAGLMIVASTYTKYIEDPDEGDPSSQLGRILSMEECVGASPLAELDALYGQVLLDLKSKLNSNSQVTSARDIIAFVILAPGGIGISDLASLSRVKPSYVRSILRRLTAVILLLDDNVKNIAPFHASFGEYMQDSTRCTVQELSINTEAAFGRIAVQCSDVIASATRNGILGVEYDCARGYAWTPTPWDHIGRSLAFYLSRCPPAQLEELKTAFETGIWTLLNMLHAGWFLLDLVRIVDAARVPASVLGIEGSSEEERAASLGRLLITRHRMLINTVRMGETLPAEGCQLSRRQALKFSQFVGSRAVWNEAEGTLNILGNIVCWMKYTHSNLMSFKGIEVKFDDDDMPREVLVFVAATPVIRHASSLLGYLQKDRSLDVASRARMALGIADGLRYLHESSPPQPYNGVTPHQIMVSEGQPILYPSTWNLDWQSSLSPNDNDDVDELRSIWDFEWWSTGWDHWNPTGERSWERSVEARLHVDIWDFGSLLYQMIMGEEPLIAYNRLAEGNEAFGYNAANEKVPDEYWGDVNRQDISHYEAAVLLLLNAVESSEGVKELLKSCWAIRGEDRPPMGEVFRRLKAIVEHMET